MVRKRACTAAKDRKKKYCQNTHKSNILKHIQHSCQDPEKNKEVKEIPRPTCADDYKQPSHEEATGEGENADEDPSDGEEADEDPADGGEADEQPMDGGSTEPTDEEVKAQLF